VANCNVCLIPLRIDKAGVDADTDCRLDGRFDASVHHVLGYRVGHVKNIAVINRLIWLLAVKHALEIEGGHCTAALLLADEQGPACGCIQAGTPGH